MLSRPTSSIYKHIHQHTQVNTLPVWEKKRKKQKKKKTKKKTKKAKTKRCTFNSVENSEGSVVCSSAFSCSCRKDKPAN